MILICVVVMCLSGSASAVKVIPWDEMEKMQQLQNTEPETCESCVLPVLPWLCLVGGAGIFGYLYILPKYEKRQKQKAYEMRRAESLLIEKKARRGGGF